MYEQFLNPQNGVYYAFVEAQIEALQTVVPEGAPYSQVVITSAEYDENGNETVPVVTRQKTIAEFSGWITKSLDETKAIVCLTAKQAEYGRMNGVTEFDLEDWDGFLTAYGFGSEQVTWMTLDDCQAKLSTSDYSISTAEYSIEE